MEYHELLQRQRAYFDSGFTLPLEARRRALHTLLLALTVKEEALLTALETDLGKVPYEGYMTEVGLVRAELRFLLDHLRGWMQPRRVPTPLAQFPAVSTIRPEPYGVTLIVTPWNYPVQLSLIPLAGALAAGNCAVIKLPEQAPASGKVLAELIAACFSPKLAATVEGGPEEAQALLEEKFDYIFFTGSPAVGRRVMERAARDLIPVTLELGGKSPVIVTADADLELAARRILFGKLLNAGQTCVAPDYVLAEQSILEPLIRALSAQLTKMLGPDPLSNPEYPKIVNERHLNRLQGLLDGVRVLQGGQIRGGRMSPALVLPDSPEVPVMQEEIFGPILPLLPFDTLEDAIAFVRARPKPLALYLFTKNRKTERLVLERTSFGGGCVNDTVVHLSTTYLPFGGVGESGMGAYHGKASFDTFSHPKSVLHRANWLDIPLRYPPFTPFKERLLHQFLK